MKGLRVPADSETILIAYGSNLSFGAQSASQGLKAVVKALEQNGVIMNKISRLWASQAWPDPSQPPFVNAVMAVETGLRPAPLLAVLHEVERAFGRRRGELNAPRTVDLDLIAYGGEVINREGLSLPHPRAHERGFVMGPLSEILPDWVHPALRMPAKDLYKNITISLDAHPLDDDLAR